MATYNLIGGTESFDILRGYDGYGTYADDKFLGKGGPDTFVDVDVGDKIVGGKGADQLIFDPDLTGSGTVKWGDFSAKQGDEINLIPLLGSDNEYFSLDVETHLNKKGEVIKDLVIEYQNAGEPAETITVLGAGKALKAGAIITDRSTWDDGWGGGF